MLATVRIHCGPSSMGMNTPERNSRGRIEALTTAGAASALGMNPVRASPRAQNEAPPTSMVTDEGPEATAGQGNVVEDPPEDQHDHDEDGGDQGRVQHPGQQVGPGRHRRAPDALQHALVPGVGHAHGQVRVGRGDHREGQDRARVVGGVGDLVAAGQRGRVVAQERGEDHQEDQREGEREEGGRWVAPERLLLEADLAHGQGQATGRGWPATDVRRSSGSGRPPGAGPATRPAPVLGRRPLGVGGQLQVDVLQRRADDLEGVDVHDAGPRPIRPTGPAAAAGRRWTARGGRPRACGWAGAPRPAAAAAAGHRRPA